VGTYRGLWVVMLVCAAITVLGATRLDTRRAPAESPAA
jgi:hypothetical protein